MPTVAEALQMAEQALVANELAQADFIYQRIWKPRRTNRTRSTDAAW